MTVEYEDDYEEEIGGGAGRWVIAGVAALVLAGGAFFAGQALAGGGPSTLAEAVEQAQAGDLPCGDTGDANATPDPQGGPPAGGGGFAVRAICNRGPQQGQGAPPDGFRGAGGFGPTGQVVSVEGSKLTLKGQQGNITVTLGPETTISRTAKGAASDLKPGQTVVVGGAGRAGSGTATSVLITGAN